MNENIPSGVEAINDENAAEAYERLNSLIWEGDYDGALPLADKLFAFKDSMGHRTDALVPRASHYYSAATAAFQTGGWNKKLEVGSHLNEALQCLQERIQSEMSRRNLEGKGLIPVSLEDLSADELDVMQTVYRRAAEFGEKIPLAEPILGVLSKDFEGLRTFDAAALLALRAGLKKVRSEQASGTTSLTGAFLLYGMFSLANRYGWEQQIGSLSQELFALGETYDWPEPPATEEEARGDMTLYGQHARLARMLRDTADAQNNADLRRHYEEKLAAYSQFIKDQKNKR